MCQPILSDYLAKKKITLSKREKLERMKKKKKPKGESNSWREGVTGKSHCILYKTMNTLRTETIAYRKMIKISNILKNVKY